MRINLIDLIMALLKYFVNKYFFIIFFLDKQGISLYIIDKLVLNSNKGGGRVKSPQSADISILRNINAKAVVDCIFYENAASRTELAKKLRLSKSSVSSNLAPLLECGAVIETGEGETTQSGGRKPRLLTFNKNVKYILAIDLNATAPLFVLGNMAGEQIAQFSVNVPDAVSEKGYLSLMVNTADLLLKAGGITEKDLFCIGIASPGVFDEGGKQISKNLNFRGAKWKALGLEGLRERYSVPIMLRNDVKSAALGEWNLSCKDRENMLYLSCGQGIGTGLILNGRLFEGSFKAAGEIYNYVDKASFKAGDTVEDIICIQGLLSRMEKEIAAGVKTSLPKSNLTFEDVVKCYSKEDEYTCKRVEGLSRSLNIIIANIVNLLDIDRVIIGGEYQVFTKTISSCFHREFDRLCRVSPTITEGKLNRFAGVQGIFYEARELYFQSICK